MSDTVAHEMHTIVRSAGEPWAPGDSVKVAISRASRMLGISARRARTFWYAQPCAVLAREADALRVKHDALLAERRRRLIQDLDRVEAELRDLGERLARVQQP